MARTSSNTWSSRIAGAALSASLALGAMPGAVLPAQAEPAARPDAVPVPAGNCVIAKADSDGAKAVVEAEPVLSRSGDAYLIGYGSPEQAADAAQRLADVCSFAEADSTVSAADGERPDAPGISYADGMDPIAELEDAVSPAAASGDTAPITVGSVFGGLLDAAATLFGGASPEGGDPGDGDGDEPDKVKVAIVDSGAPNKDNVVKTIGMLGDDVSDESGHATEMLSDIEGQGADVDVIAVKVLNADNVGTVASAYAGIEAAIAEKPDIINLSFYAPLNAESSAIASAVEDATAAGITVVAAAGNDGADAGGYVPAGVEPAVTAGACDGTGIPLPESNKGPVVDLFAAGDTSSHSAAKTTGWIATHMGADISEAADGTVFFGNPEHAAPAGQADAGDAPAAADPAPGDAGEPVGQPSEEDAPADGADAGGEAEADVADSEAENPASEGGLIPEESRNAMPSDSEASRDTPANPEQAADLEDDMPIESGSTKAPVPDAETGEFGVVPTDPLFVRDESENEELDEMGRELERRNLENLAATEVRAAATGVGKIDSGPNVWRYFDSIAAVKGVRLIDGKYAWCLQDGISFPDGKKVTLKKASSSDAISDNALKACGIAYYYIFELNQFKNQATKKNLTKPQKWGAMQGAVWYYVKKYGDVSSMKNTSFRTSGNKENFTGSNKNYTSTSEYGKLYKFVSDNMKKFDVEATVGIVSGAQNTILQFDVEYTSAVVTMKKQSTTTLTSGDSSYSLNGAVYGVFTTENRAITAAKKGAAAATKAQAKEDVLALKTAVNSRLYTTDTDGEADIAKLTEGETYWLAEIWPSKGYAQNMTPTKFTVTATPTKDQTVTTKESPKPKPVPVQLKARKYYSAQPVTTAITVDKSLPWKKVTIGGETRYQATIDRPAASTGYVMNCTSSVGTIEAHYFDGKIQITDSATPAIANGGTARTVWLTAARPRSSDLAAKTFTFELVDGSGKVIKTAQNISHAASGANKTSNGIDGDVNFPQISFNKTGTYTYYIREKRSTPKSTSFAAQFRPDEVYCKRTDVEKPWSGATEGQKSYRNSVWIDTSNASSTKIYDMSNKKVVVKVTKPSDSMQLKATVTYYGWNNSVTGGSYRPIIGNAEYKPASVPIELSAKKVLGGKPAVISKTIAADKFSKSGSVWKATLSRGELVSGATGLGDIVSISTNNAGISAYYDDAAKTITVTDVNGKAAGGEYTARVNVAFRTLDAPKLNAGAYSFDLLDSTGKVIRSADNDAKGNVKFSSVSITDAGTHTFKIREVVPDGAEAFEYLQGTGFADCDSIRARVDVYNGVKFADANENQKTYRNLLWYDASNHAAYEATREVTVITKWSGGKLLIDSIKYGGWNNPFEGGPNAPVFANWKWEPESQPGTFSARAYKRLRGAAEPSEELKPSQLKWEDGGAFLKAVVELPGNMAGYGTYELSSDDADTAAAIYSGDLYCMPGVDGTLELFSDSKFVPRDGVKVSAISKAAKTIGQAGSFTFELFDPDGAKVAEAKTNGTASAVFPDMTVDERHAGTPVTYTIRESVPAQAQLYTMTGGKLVQASPARAYSAASQAEKDNPDNVWVVKKNESGRTFCYGYSSEPKKIRVLMTHPTPEEAKVETTVLDGNGLPATSEFVNRIWEEGRDPGKISLGAQKKLSGTSAKPADGAYTFKLTGEDDDVNLTAKNDENGTVQFPEQEYPTEGTWHYTIKEVIPEDAIAYRGKTQITRVVDQSADADAGDDSPDGEGEGDEFDDSGNGPESEPLTYAMALAEEAEELSDSSVSWRVLDNGKLTTYDTTEHSATVTCTFDTATNRYIPTVSYDTGNSSPTFTNTVSPVRAGIAIRKYDAETGHALSGCFFNVYRGRFSHYEDAIASGAPAARLETKGEGLAQTAADALDAGEYTVIESAAPAGYMIDFEWCKNISVDAGNMGTVIADDLKGVDLICRDYKETDVHAGLKVKKVDAGTDAPLDGAVFRVSCLEGDDKGKTWDMSSTTTEGVYELPSGTFSLGRYEVVEAKAPTGYDLNTDWKAEFTVSSDLDDGHVFNFADVEVNGEPNESYSPCGDEKSFRLPITGGPGIMCTMAAAVAVFLVGRVIRRMTEPDGDEAEQ